MSTPPPAPSKLRLLLSSLGVAVIASAVYLVFGLIAGHSLASIALTVGGMIVVVTLVYFVMGLLRQRSIATPPRR